MVSCTNVLCLFGRSQLEWIQWVVKDVVVQLLMRGTSKNCAAITGRLRSNMRPPVEADAHLVEDLDYAGDPHLFASQIPVSWAVDGIRRSPLRVRIQNFHRTGDRVLALGY